MSTKHPVSSVSQFLVSVLGFLLIPLGASGGGERLTSRPLPPPPAIKRVAVGEELRTGSGQRRRVVLPDGSVVYLNQQTRVSVTAERRLKLTGGEVFLEVAPHNEGKNAFVVEVGKREVSALGTAFAVRAGARGAGVLVTRGRVKVSGLDKELHAGQQLPAGSDKPEAAPRPAFALAWARELVEASETPLVPRSRHAGGSLVAVDPNGQEARLSLRNYRVDVHFEDGFARTTIDQTYFNHHPTRLEGTFFFPLPADASLSRLAMYVDGTRMEGGMAERDYARNVYERIVESQRDPALLEWVDGSTFKMRVFPLEPRQEKRVLLSYTQKLPALYGEASYRFPAGHSLDRVGEWSFHARIKGGAALAWQSASHTLNATKDKGDLVLDSSEKSAKLDRDLVLTLGGEAKTAARFSSMTQDGATYLMLRYRPELPVQAQRQRRDWVFLFESSGDRDPLLARTQVELIRGLLQNAEPDDTFAVVAANTRPHPQAKERRPVTPQNVAEAVAFLEGSHLIGALDLDQALTAATALLKDAPQPYLVHVGSGIAAMGEQRTEMFVKCIPAGVRYVGLGVGRRWNRALMKAAAEKSGGYFAQVNPDESLSWRAFELASALNTPRLLDLAVSDDTGKNRWLTFASMVGHGEEVCAVTRLDGKRPEHVTVRGSLDGRPFQQGARVGDVAEGAGYLPRTWAKLEIERLLVEHAAKNKQAIIALSKAMYVMTPFTSLLVLENEAMYQQFNVDRGRKDHWALYPAPETIPVFSEDEDGNRIDPKKAARPAPNQLLETMAARTTPQVLDAPAEVKRASGLRSSQIPRGGEWTRGFGGFVLNKSEDTISAALADPLTIPPPARARPFVTEATKAISIQGVSHDVVAEALDAMRSRRGIREGSSAPEIGGLAGEFARNSPGQSPVLAGEPKLIAIPIRKGGAETLARTLQAAFPNSRIRASATADGILLAYGSPDDLAAIQRATESAQSMGGQDPADSWKAPGIAVYRRPSFSCDDRLFYDLVSHAPGMNTSRADVLAVLEEETIPGLFGKLGRLDDGARRLFERNRSAGWQSLQLPADGDGPGFTVVFDGSGRYAYDRMLPPGIREHVVCDGKTLLHLYPDLHLGARRSVSRHHRLDFTRMVPWALPRAEDLARGADVRFVDARTVAVIPHGAGSKDEKGKAVPYLVTQFRFDEGRLSEQRVIDMPSEKVLSRTLLGSDGTLKLLDGNGEEISVRKGMLSPAKAPELAPDVKEFVVLPLPYRNREHVTEARKLKDVALPNLSFDNALALFAAEFGAGKGDEALKVFKEAFHGRDQRQLGFYVLLAACGQNLDAQNVDVLAEHPDVPLAQYLALHSSPVLRKHASQWAAASAQWGDGFLRHLALTHSLLQRWSNSGVLEGEARTLSQRLTQAVDYVQKHQGTAFGFALLGLMQDRAVEAEKKKESKSVWVAIEKLWPLYAKVPGLETTARYEHARTLWKAGRREEGRQRFAALYAEALQQDALLRFDADFHQALLGSGDEKDLFSPLLRDAAKRLVARRQRPAVLALARQSQQVGDKALAANLLAVALDGITDNKERLNLTMAAAEFLRQTGQHADAERRLRSLLEDAELGKRAAVWRLAERIASGRDRPARELECLERALDAEFHALPEVINLESVRTDYGRLLDHYQSLADAMTTLKVEPPKDFAAKVVRVTDRWRSLDRDAGEACRLAARVLRTLGGQGNRELSWDYLTTPVGLLPNEAAPWTEQASILQREGELGLADQAFASAFAAEPTNAQLLWDRAQNLRQAGRLSEGDQLLRQLVEGSWQPRFQTVQRQARWQLDNR